MDKKIAENLMEETVQLPTPQPIKITYNYDDLLKRRAAAQEQAEAYANVVKDIDALIARLDVVGCKPIKQE